MKKLLAGSLLTALVLAGCGGGNGGASEEETSTLKVGASNVPHAIILEQAKPLLEEQGIELDIETYQDYILPNQDLEAGEIDANYFQHIPYLESQKKEFGYDFENAGGIHIEPIGVYSQKYASLEELPEGATILMSNSVADHGRILSMLEAQGLIKLAEGIDKTTAEVKDIVENPKNLEFDANYEAALMVQLYEAGEGDALLINSNYAIDAGLSPLEDSIALESSESPYVNIIAVNKGDEDSENIKALVETLKSQEIQDFILEEWGGAVVPVK
ncbi:MetQ/NlpA family ABC transporter substrate-binding protein [Planococcus shenhongbingii]|uniref:Lipoprotein n=1 Tax=Planococcus shenhongbingii TaxID=3058398 RepID=A0ABT8NH60_9BACL|nr:MULTISPECIES: MetQ/NlpA family ABC transporter substrate-binding protein [unclassified Planococcus (in: firmicutes)]MDN7247245.1 MetQ/NlpA family ABC transporter substrate-binding protein [Planococcus sp. N017]WKA59731.1 MetQ/NlpA family ABC transporter substrate-binding protein [Planococcus sp. N016]